MLLKCQCCGIQRIFRDADDAIRVGWDASEIVCCDLCPILCINMGFSHAKAHALWEREGRPRQFSVAKCGIDEHLQENGSRRHRLP